MIDSVRDRTLALSGLWLTILLLCWASAQHFIGTPGLTAVWPANAVALAFIVRLCRDRRTTLMALAVTVTAMITANLIVGRPLGAALLFPFANGVEIAVAAWFLRNVAMPMTSPRDLGQFLLGGVLAGPLVSTLMAGVVMAGLFEARGQVVIDMSGAWFMADALGMAIVGPFLLSLARTDRAGLMRALGTALIVFGIAFALCFQTRLPLLFLGFPMVTLAVLHDRARGGALAVVAVASAVICAGLLGHGPAIKMATGGLDSVQVLEVYFAALVITVHPLAAAMTRLDALAADARRRQIVAEADSAAKTEILGRVGEDIRSPLTGVVTVAEMLRSGRLGDLNARQRDLLGRIAESGAEIEALSREMMVLADGKSSEPRLASVTEVMKEAVEAARFQARRRKVEFELLTGAAGWEAAIDPERLKRILLDGLTAALEVSAPHDRIRVVAGLEGRERVRITVEDAHAPSVQARAARLDDPLDPLTIDRMDLTRFGAGLDFGAGALGGGRLVIELPLVMRRKAAA